MACREHLVSYLQQHGVPFETARHAEVYTAQEVAQVEHVPGKALAKVVMVKANDHLLMLVLPASHKVNFGLLEQVVGRKVRLATEHEFAHVFPDCEVGAEPPFGNLYGVPVYVDQSLTGDEHIVFNDGSHRETMRVAYKDYERLVNPKVATFAVQPAGKRALA